MIDEPPARRRLGERVLLLLPASAPVAAGTQAAFDLMVDDRESFREHLLGLGHQPGEIAADLFHRFFTLQEPGGHEVTINSPM